MKILIASGIFLPEIGGPATYAYKLARELIKRGITVDILTYSNGRGESGSEFDELRIERIVRRGKVSNYLRYAKAFYQLERNNNYDIVYCFDHFSSALPVVVVNKLLRLRKRIIVRVGGDFIWERYLERTGNLITLPQFYQQHLHLRAERVRFFLIRWLFSQFDKIIFTSGWQREIFIPIYNLNPRQTEIIPNPIDINIIRQRKELSSVNRQIIFVGRFVNKNNIIFLIDAFSQMEDKSFTLHLIGEGPREEYLRHYIKERQLGDRVFIESKRIGKNLEKRLTRAYLVVFPSLSDISPNSLLECLRLGVPFINTREIGYKWLAGKAKQFDPQNKSELVSVLNELSKEEVYRSYCSELASINYRYTFSEAADKNLAVISQLL